MAAAVTLPALPTFAVERLGYQLIESYPEFELRQYDDHLLATTVVDDDFERAGNRAFRDLFGYIDGGNAAAQSISMTAPVTQTPSGSGYEVGFVMPGHLTAESLPRPASDTVQIVARAGTLMAVRRYSGGWSESRYRKHESQLRQAVTSAGYAICGPATWARFDPPFMPSFWRSNEILFPVVTASCDAATDSREDQAAAAR